LDWFKTEPAAENVSSRGPSFDMSVVVVNKYYMNWLRDRIEEYAGMPISLIAPIKTLAKIGIRATSKIQHADFKQ
jgi:hypothetical protein